MEVVDIDFNPNEFSIPANIDVTVHLPNLGEIVHNVHINPLDVHLEDVDPGGETADHLFHMLHPRDASTGRYQRDARTAQLQWPAAWRCEL